jgi:hypothetical protein
MKKKHIVLLSFIAIIAMITCYFWNDLVTLFQIGKLVISDENSIEQLLTEELGDQNLDILPDSNITTDDNAVVNEPQNSEPNQEPKQQPDQQIQQQVNEKNSNSNNSNNINSNNPYKPETSL